MVQGKAVITFHAVIRSGRVVKMEQATMVAEMLRKDQQVLKAEADKLTGRTRFAAVMGAREVLAHIEETSVRANTNWARIDLHGMTAAGVAEFVRMVNDTTTNAKLVVITGAGNHSKRNVTLIKLGVLEFFKNIKVPVSEVNPGCYMVKKQ